MTSYPADKSTDLALAHVAAIEDEKIDPSFVDKDSIVEGTVDVTHHELATLRHAPDALPWASWLVLFVEFAEVSSKPLYSIFCSRFIFFRDGRITELPICIATTFVLIFLLAPSMGRFYPKTDKVVLLVRWDWVCRRHSLFVSVFFSIHFHYSSCRIGTVR
jgi:hypothetical protein